jgi:hypothetical protein
VYQFAQTTNHVYEKVRHHDGRLPLRNAYGYARERRQEIAESPHYCHDGCGRIDSGSCGSAHGCATLARDPSTNFGWLLKSALSGPKRFGSRQGPSIPGSSLLVELNTFTPGRRSALEPSGGLLLSSGFVGFALHLEDRKRQTGRSPSGPDSSPERQRDVGHGLCADPLRVYKVACLDLCRDCECHATGGGAGWGVAKSVRVVPLRTVRTLMDDVKWMAEWDRTR